MRNQDPESIRKGVLGWLASKGYPLEMQAAKLLLGFGLGVRQGWHYEDPRTTKPREIDIIASTYIDGDVVLLLQLVIECKRSLDPIVAFTYGPNLAKPLNEHWVPTNQLGHSFLNKATETGLLSRIPIYQPAAPVAYSLTQARINKDETTSKGIDAGYEALSAVSKAAHNLSVIYTNKVKSVPDPTRAGSSKSVAYIAIPVVVLEAPLLVCYLSEKGEPTVEPLQALTVEWAYPPVGTLMVKVVTIDALAPFAASFIESTAQLRPAALPILAELSLPQLPSYQPEHPGI